MYTLQCQTGKCDYNKIINNKSYCLHTLLQLVHIPTYYSLPTAPYYLLISQQVNYVLIFAEHLDPFLFGLFLYLLSIVFLYLLMYLHSLVLSTLPCSNLSFLLNFLSFFLFFKSCLLPVATCDHCSYFYCQLLFACSFYFPFLCSLQLPSIEVYSWTMYTNISKWHLKRNYHTP